MSLGSRGMGEPRQPQGAQPPPSSCAQAQRDFPSPHPAALVQLHRPRASQSRGRDPGQQPSEGAAAGREATLTQENAELRMGMFPHLGFKESVCLLFSVFIWVR